MRRRPTTECIHRLLAVSSFSFTAAAAAAAAPAEAAAVIFKGLVGLKLLCWVVFAVAAGVEGGDPQLRKSDGFVYPHQTKNAPLMCLFVP